jgi:hypothetical protein
MCIHIFGILCILCFYAYIEYCVECDLKNELAIYDLLLMLFRSSLTMHSDASYGSFDS